MKRKFTIAILLISSVLLISLYLVFFTSSTTTLNDNRWVAYFAPSSTDVAYGDTNAKLIEIDSDGNTKTHGVDAYPFTGLINYNDNLIFQTPKGLSKLNNSISSLNANLDNNTVGYHMADILKEKNIYYFLSNEEFKETFYSSKLILGDDTSQYSHQIEGFINAYGNDNSNIFLLASDMINKNSKQLQKISINSTNDISIKTNTINFNTETDSNFKMIVLDNYIYCFIIKNKSTVSLLKISKDTLNIENTFDLIDFDPSIENDPYYPLSTNSIFYHNDKIYYPSVEGTIYSFNIKTNKFIEEFKLKNYDINSSYNASSYFSTINNELYIFYFDESKNIYTLDSYNLNGDLNYTIPINNLNIKDNLYPHSFIKLE